MKVTVGIIAYNEENYINNLFEDILGQDYPLKEVEIILVDGLSRDKTKNLMLEFAEQNRDKFFNIQVLDNKKRIQAAGWNIVIKNADTDLIIRLDAHATVPQNFISKNISCISGGEYVCGGTRENIIDDFSFGKKGLLLAEKSMFGSGIAKFRNATQKEYVNTLAHGCYRKEVFDKAGLFNENLLRSEDNEMHYRIRRAGYKICLDPEIKSYYMTRNTYKGICRQKYGNGKWVGATCKLSLKIFSLYHFIPLLFFLAIVATSVLLAVSLFTVPYLSVFAIALWALYGLLLIFTGVSVSVKEKNILYLFYLPFIIFSLHISYGIGTLIGLITIPKKRLTSQEVKDGEKV